MAQAFKKMMDRGLLAMGGLCAVRRESPSTTTTPIVETEQLETDVS